VFTIAVHGREADKNFVFKAVLSAQRSFPGIQATVHAVVDEF
jgi:hypothetical protein